MSRFIGQLAVCSSVQQLVQICSSTLFDGTGSLVLTPTFEHALTSLDVSASTCICITSQESRYPFMAKDCNNNVVFAFRNDGVIRLGTTQSSTPPVSGLLHFDGNDLVISVD